MWVKLTGDLGTPLFVNLDQMSVVRPAVVGAKGCRLAFLSGAAVPVKQPAREVMRALSKQRPEHRMLWLKLTGEAGKDLYANLDLARVARPGPRGVGGAMLVFLPDFTVFVRESPEQIAQLLREHPNKLAAGRWIKVRGEHRKPLLINSFRLATIRPSPQGKEGSMLTFLAGGQVFVRPSPQEIVAAVEKVSPESNKGTP